MNDTDKNEVLTVLRETAAFLAGLRASSLRSDARPYEYFADTISNAQYIVQFTPEERAEREAKAEAEHKALFKMQQGVAGDLAPTTLGGGEVGGFQ